MPVYHSSPVLGYTSEPPMPTYNVNRTPAPGTPAGPINSPGNPFAPQSPPLGSPYMSHAFHSSSPVHSDYDVSAGFDSLSVGNINFSPGQPTLFGSSSPANVPRSVLEPVCPSSTEANRFIKDTLDQLRSRGTQNGRGPAPISHMPPPPAVPLGTMLPLLAPQPRRVLSIPNFDVAPTIPLPESPQASPEAPSATGTYSSYQPYSAHNLDGPMVKAEESETELCFSTSSPGEDSHDLSSQALPRTTSPRGILSSPERTSAPAPSLNAMPLRDTQLGYQYTGVDSVVLEHTGVPRTGTLPDISPRSLPSVPSYEEQIAEVTKESPSTTAPNTPSRARVAFAPVQPTVQETAAAEFSFIHRSGSPTPPPRSSRTGTTITVNAAHTIGTFITYIRTTNKANVDSFNGLVYPPVPERQKTAFSDNFGVNPKQAFVSVPAPAGGRAYKLAVIPSHRSLLADNSDEMPHSAANTLPEIVRNPTPGYQADSEDHALPSIRALHLPTLQVPKRVKHVTFEEPVNPARSFREQASELRRAIEDEEAAQYNGDDESSGDERNYL
ncbi:hypothetical protein FRC12_005622 [Ceratobasidium sp. 428]|nr:hypothetical protein FRC12_005622 [Ceratobasidium sp. 428]